MKGYMTDEEFGRGVRALLQKNDEVTKYLLMVVETLPRVQTIMEKLEQATGRTIDIADKVFENGDRIVTVLGDLTEVMKQTNAAVIENTDRLAKVMGLIESYFGDGSSVRYEN
jgi:hypothetical protein